MKSSKIPAVLDMIAELDRRTEDDLSRGVIAKWHDESISISCLRYEAAPFKVG